MRTVRGTVDAEMVRFNAVYDRIVSNIVSRIVSRIDIDKPYSVEAIVDEVLAKEDFDKRLKDLVIAGVVDTAQKVAPIAGIAYKRWYMESGIMQGVGSFSQRTTALGSGDAIKSTLQQAVASGKSWREAAMDISRVRQREGFTQADIAKDVNALIAKARKTYTVAGDTKGYEEYKKQAEALKRRISRMVSPDTNKLRAAYNQLASLTKDSSIKVVERAAKYSAYFKERYNAERIARTEYANSYGQAFFSEQAYDDAIIGWRAVLSSSHTIRDICDFHTSVNMYGLGPGGYPKGKGPQYPFHPHCVLPGQEVFWFGNLTRAYKSFYCGDVIKITTSRGLILSVTSNHPILTLDGWVAAKDIVKGQKVLTRKVCKRPSWISNPNNNNTPTLIENVFSSIKKSFFMFSQAVPSSAKHFHNDGACIDGNIDIVNTDGLLWRDINNSFFDKIVNKLLLCGINFPRIFNTIRPINKIFNCFLGASNFIVSGLCDCSTSFWGVISFNKKPGGFGDTSWRNTFFNKYPLDSVSRNPDFVRYFLYRISRKIFPDDIVSVDKLRYSGHVYDLQCDPTEIYICSGVIVKNCTCQLEDIYGMEPRGTTQPNDEKAQRYLSRLSQADRVKLLGVDGAKQFAENPTSWQSSLKNWNGHTSIKATIQKEILYGGEED